MSPCILLFSDLFFFLTILFSNLLTIADYIAIYYAQYFTMFSELLNMTSCTHVRIPLNSNYRTLVYHAQLYITKINVIIAIAMCLWYLLIKVWVYIMIDINDPNNYVLNGFETSSYHLHDCCCSQSHYCFHTHSLLSLYHSQC